MQRRGDRAVVRRGPKLGSMRLLTSRFWEIAVLLYEDIADAIVRNPQVAKQNWRSAVPACWMCKNAPQCVHG
jgi:hypothetical protein